MRPSHFLAKNSKRTRLGRVPNIMVCGAIIQQQQQQQQPREVAIGNTTCKTDKSSPAMRIGSHAMQRALCALLPPLPVVFRGVITTDPHTQCPVVRHGEALWRSAERFVVLHPGGCASDRQHHHQQQHQLVAEGSTLFRLFTPTVRAAVPAAMRNIPMSFKSTSALLIAPSMYPDIRRYQTRRRDVADCRNTAFIAENQHWPPSFVLVSETPAGRMDDDHAAKEADEASKPSTIRVGVEALTERIPLTSTNRGCVGGAALLIADLGEAARVHRHGAAQPREGCLSWLWNGNCWVHEDDPQLAQALSLYSASKSMPLAAFLAPTGHKPSRSGGLFDATAVVCVSLSKQWSVAAGSAVLAQHSGVFPHFYCSSGSSRHVGVGNYNIPNGVFNTCMESLRPSQPNYNGVTGEPLGFFWHYKLLSNPSKQPVANLSDSDRGNLLCNPFYVSHLSKQVCWVPEGAIQAQGLSPRPPADRCAALHDVAPDAKDSSCVASMPYDLYVSGFFIDDVPGWFSESLQEALDLCCATVPTRLEFLFAGITKKWVSCDDRRQPTAERKSPLLYVLAYTPSAATELVWQRYTLEEVASVNFIFPMSAVAPGGVTMGEGVVLSLLQHLLACCGLAYAPDDDNRYFMDLRAALCLLQMVACKVHHHPLKAYEESAERLGDGDDGATAVLGCGARCHAFTAHFVDFFVGQYRQSISWEFVQWDCVMQSAITSSPEDTASDVDVDRSESEEEDCDPADASLHIEEGADFPGHDDDDDNDARKAQEEQFLAQFTVRRDEREHSAADVDDDQYELWERTGEGRPDMPAVDRRQYTQGSRLEDPLTPPYVVHRRRHKLKSVALGPECAASIWHASAHARHEQLLLSLSSAKSQERLDAAAVAVDEAPHPLEDGDMDISRGALTRTMRLERLRAEARWRPWLRLLHTCGNSDGLSMVSPASSVSNLLAASSNAGSSEQSVWSWDIGIHVIHIKYAERYVNASNTMFTEQ